MIRPEMTSAVPRNLWDKITESVVGHPLSSDVSEGYNSSILIPSLENVLYDQLNGTDTRFGLGEGQAFVRKSFAINTILAYFNDSSIDFENLDIAALLGTDPFSSKEESVLLMNKIYTSIPTVHVNRIFFSVLHDVFTTKSKIPEIMKTSMVSLHGIKLLETNGQFDD
jgi:hypothetical protein